MLRPLPILAALALGSPAFAGEPPRYRAIEVPGSGYDLDPFAFLNDLGQVVYYCRGQGYRIWSPDGTDIAIPTMPNASDVVVTGINNSGDVLFVERRENGITESRSVVWNAVTGYTRFDWNTWGYGITDDGWVGGGGGGLNLSPFIWNYRTGEATFLDLPPGTTGASVSDITETGYAVGYGVLWTNRVPRELEHPASSFAFAPAINNYGLSVGRILEAGDADPAIWSNQGQLLIRLEGPESGAFSEVNDFGIAVGATTERAFLYHPSWGQIYFDDLDVGMSLPGLGSTEVNNRNEILAGRMVNGRIQYYLLQPVPEPATLTALGLGALALLRRHKSRLRR